METLEMIIDKPYTIEVALRGAVNTGKDFHHSADSICAIVNTISNNREREKVMDMLIDFLKNYPKWKWGSEE